MHIIIITSHCSKKSYWNVQRIILQQKIKKKIKTLKKKKKKKKKKTKIKSKSNQIGAKERHSREQREQ
jgi:hypothetical protein